MKKFSYFVLLSLVLVLVISAGSVAAQEEGIKVLRGMLAYDEIPTLDPGIMEDVPSVQVTNMMIVGLTALASSDSATVPGIAESWDIVENDDGTATYTFHMMQEVPWVRYDAEAGEVVQVTDDAGNVRYVNAHDVVYGMLRTLTPATASNYEYVLEPRVVGAAEYYSGEGSVDDVAIRALDDYTVEIVAPFLAGANLQIYGMWMSRPVPQWAIDEFAELWVEPGNYQSYGPYTMKDWVHGDSITLIKNPFWPGTDSIPQPKIDELYLVFRQQSTAMSMFEAGELDWLSDVPAADLDRIRADPVLAPELTTAPGVCSYYYGLNVESEPFNNVHLRLAFSYALDREAIVDNVTRGGQIPAQWFTIPSMAGAPSLDTYPDLGIWYDPDKAQEELQAYLDEMGYTSVDEIPAISLLYNTSETHAAIAQAAQQMWVDELGIEVQLTNQEFQVYLDSRRDFEMYRAGWCKDFMDADNFMTEWTTAADADNHYSNPVMDELVLQARQLVDVEARRELYAQAEELLVYTDAAIIPIYWYVKLQMTAPNVERTVALDQAESFFEWDINP
jgi:oligopeptide transport system substrate-binding protein